MTAYGINMTHSSAASPLREMTISSRRVDEVVRRLLDILAGSLGLLLTLPLLVVCGLWIKWMDPGPVLYCQWRVGCQGWLFPIYKLRTMRLKAENLGETRFAVAGDPRVLPGCNWMRKSHIDELPQLWNILLGQMTLVGPRPERPEVFDELCSRIPGFSRRIVVRPGLTGLAQVKSGYTNDLQGMRRKLAYDLRYLRQRSLLTDLRLLFRTVPCVWDRSAL